MARPTLPVTVGLSAALVLSLTGTAAQAAPANLQAQVQPQALATTTAAISGDTYASRTTVLADSFQRTLSRGWGVGTTGKSWTTWGNTRLDGNRGILANARMTGQGARANGVSVRDHETQVVITPGATPTANLYLSFVHRQVSGARYETRVIFRPDGTADFELSKKTSAGERSLGVSKRGVVKAVPGKDIVLRFSAVDEDTTTLSASLWEASKAESTGTSITRTDNTPELRKAGGIGVETYLGGSRVASNVGINDWKTEEVVPLSALPAPKPEPAPAPAPETEEAVKPEVGAGLATGGDLATVPASKKGVGAVPLGKTNYAIPADALHVKAGADASRGNGQAATPFASIQSAVWNAKPGQTIVVHEGVYHEYIGVFNDPKWDTNHDRTTIQAAPGAEVWLDGAKKVTSWTRSGTTWTAPWQDHQNFNTIAGFGNTDLTGNLAFAGPQNPLASDSSQVFIDGRQLKQVAANPGAGQFAVDRSNPSAKKLILGEDPTGKEVRASYLTQAIVSNVNNLVVRGIGVRGYATPLNWMGTVYSVGNSPLFENMVFDSLPTVPLSLAAAPGAVVRNNTSVFAGLNGIGSYQSDGVTMENNYVYGANQQHFNSAPVAGGVKVTQQRDFTFKNNEVTNTLGATGVWLDESVVNSTVSGNRVSNNGDLGIYAEISVNANIVSNEVTGNYGSGIQTLGTPNVWIANNYLEGNGADGAASISILQDDRRQANGGMGVDSRNPAPDPVNTWITSNVRIVNNILGEPNAKAIGQFDVHDRNGVLYADSMLSQVEGNLIVDRTTQNIARLGLPGHRTKIYADLPAVRSAHAEDWRTNTVRTSGTRADLEKAAAGIRGVTLDATLAKILGIASNPTFVGLPAAK